MLCSFLNMTLNSMFQTSILFILTLLKLISKSHKLVLKINILSILKLVQVPIIHWLHCFLFSWGNFYKTNPPSGKFPLMVWIVKGGTWVGKKTLVDVFIGTLKTFTKPSTLIYSSSVPFVFNLFFNIFGCFF